MRCGAGEMKSLKKPPPGVDDITAVVLCLLENVPKDKSWAAAGKEEFIGCLTRPGIKYLCDHYYFGDAKWCLQVVCRLF
jgi:hypothetical protein